jgi:hypothetical protein
LEFDKLQELRIGYANQEAIKMSRVDMATAAMISYWEICPKTITLLLCKLMDKHQTCSTPITSPKRKKVLHPMTSPIKHNPITSQKNISSKDIVLVICPASVCHSLIFETHI